jgi:hypothetical protein
MNYLLKWMRFDVEEVLEIMPEEDEDTEGRLFF